MGVNQIKSDEEHVCHRCGDPVYGTDVGIGKNGTAVYYCQFHYEERLRTLGVKIRICEIPKLKGCECLLD